MAAAVAAVDAEAAVIKRWISVAGLLAATGTAWGADPDLLLQTQARKDEIAPVCAGLLPKTQGLSLQQRYHKALCLLYGVQTEVRAEEAIDQLRAVATEGLLEAQLALADTLQQGTPLQQQEALQWYGRASAAGEIRATLRQARLLQRLQPPAAANSNTDEDPENAAAARQPGYHCHMYGFGKKVCHGGMD